MSTAVDQHRGREHAELTDEDSISLTSTVSSTKVFFYDVNEIVAEEVFDDGVRRYLVRWDGYPDQRCTWEIRSHFKAKTLLDWQTKKMRISRGIEQQPLDVEAWFDKDEKLKAASKERKSRRRAKRIHLGLPVAPTQTKGLPVAPTRPKRLPVAPTQTNDDEPETSDLSELSSLEENHSHESPMREKLSESTGTGQLPEHIKTLPKDIQSPSISPIAPVARMTQSWTDAEETALMSGLRVLKGRTFDYILSIYGPRGTASHVLKDKTVQELQEKTRQLYQECQDQGIEIPSHLRTVLEAQRPEPNQMQASGKAPAAVMFPPVNETNDGKISMLKSASSDTSPVEISFDEAPEPQQGQPSKDPSTAKSSPPQPKVDTDRRGSLSDQHSPPAEQAPRPSPGSSPAHALYEKCSHQEAQASKPSSATSHDHALSEKCSPLEEQASKPSVASSLDQNLSTRRQVSHPKPSSGSLLPHQVSSAFESSRRESILEPSANSTAVATKTLSEPSNSNPKDLSGTKGFQLGGKGRGPARLGQDAEKSSATTSARGDVSGARVFKNQNIDVKGRKSKASDPGTRAKPTKNSSVMRRNTKLGNEPAPDINKLTFVNLKDGGITKPFPATSKANPPPKTPFQLIQEGLRVDTNIPRSIDESSMRRDVDNDDGQSLSAVPNSEQKKRSLSMSQDVIASKPTLTPTLLRPKPTYNIGRSKAARTSNDSPLSNSPLNEGGRSIASASSRPDSAVSARRLNDTSQSRSHVKDQTTPTVSTTSAQKDRVTEAEENLISLRTTFDNDVTANVLIGPNDKRLGNVRFRGLDWSARQLLLSMKVLQQYVTVHCTHLCTVGEYEAFFRGKPDDYICSGYVVPFPPTLGPIRDMADTLRSQASGALAYCQRFSIIFYPADPGMESWAFLNYLHPSVPEGVCLRFAMRKPLPAPNPAGFDLTEQEKLLATPLEGESNISMLFRTMLDIEYGRLIKQSTAAKTAESHRFFLFFVEVPKEFSLISRFLAAHGAIMYSWDDVGAWDYFQKHVDYGVILIEGSFYQLYLIPNLARALRKSINVFNITFDADKLAPHPHINRLFPHGEVILLTDSFVLLYPREAARFLLWFRQWVLEYKPLGTWKLCMRPRIREFLLDIMDERSKDDGFPFMQIYDHLDHIIPEEYASEEDLEEDIESDSDINPRPIRCMGSGVTGFDESVGKKTVSPNDIARNDDILAEFFAGWAMTELESFRRFYIINGGSIDAAKSWEGKWSHILVHSPKIALERADIIEFERGLEKEKKEKEQAEARMKSK